MKENVAIICFTGRGCATASRIREILGKGSVWIKMKADRSFRDVQPLEEKLSVWTGKRFKDSDLIIFVGATGIAVRSIAPFLQSKKTDPAVLCVDEAGTFVISLVSGHIGGANREAKLLAEGLGAVPVITTATDLNGKFAVDVFAADNGLFISDLSLAKYMSALILDGDRIPVRSEFPLVGDMPEELVYTGLTDPKDREHLSLQIGIHDNGMRNTLYLVPGIVTVGVGCRKDKEPEELVRFISELLEKKRIHPAAVEQIATIDIKQDEPAVRAVAAHFGVQLQTFDAQALRSCPGDFTASEFVSRTVGVDNVCERSALLGAMEKEREWDRGEQSGHIELIVKKTAANGMTAAMAVREWRAYL